MGNTMTIVGGRPANGVVYIPAAKNSVLPILAACVLCRGTVQLQNVPALSDVDACLALLRGVGLDAHRAADRLVVQGNAPKTAHLPARLCGCMRASVLFVAPLLARLGQAVAVLPGGCRIGARPIDLHLELLRQMGVVQLPAAAGQLVLAAPHGLHGVEYTLRVPSVGATETALLAAATAHGDTQLHGAACEPEVQDLARFLNACGACIVGAGSPQVRIQGRRALHGATFAPMADRIVASTFACAAAAAGGQVELRGCDPATFAPVLGLLARAGCTVQTAPGAAQVQRFGRVHGVGAVRTGGYPAFATDAAPLVAAALLCADSASSLQDTVFEHRFACARGFAQMGAKVAINGRTLTVAPCKQLHAALVAAPDLRGGAALVLAALAAHGRTKIERIDHIWRGYADFGTTLADLGLCVE